MEFKGTKGEWFLRKTKKGHFKISGGRSGELVEWKDFCVVYTINDGLTNTSIQSKANAKLIAASPDLLNALLEIKKTIGYYTHKITDKRDNEWEVVELSDIEDWVEEAIKKAIG